MPRSKYTAEEKLSILTGLSKAGLSKKDYCRKYGIGLTAFRRWRDLYERDGIVVLTLLELVIELDELNHPLIHMRDICMSSCRFFLSTAWPAGSGVLHAQAFYRRQLSRVRLDTAYLAVQRQSLEREHLNLRLLAASA